MKTTRQSMFKHIITLSLAMLLTMAATAQGFFTSVDKSEIAGEPDLIIPEKFDAFELNESELLRYLNNVPMEFTGSEDEMTIELPFPGERGSMTFTIVESPVFEPGFSDEFPNIKTYRGQGIEDPTAVMRMDVTMQGFHAAIRSSEGTVYIDPYHKAKTDYYMSYFVKDVAYEGKFECQSDHTHPEETEYQGGGDGKRVGGELRTYRMAVAAEGEYTVFFGGVAPAQNAIITTINRANLVYEQELSVRLIVVANNSMIVAPDPATDPFTASGSALLNENQFFIDSVIGFANYDIGHLFRSGPLQGLAQLDAVCGAGKARGFSSDNPPSGYRFDAFLLGHELGHMYGANHAQNNDCNRSFPSSIEPGSGSTIMSYAGICSPDVQPLGDDYYNGHSLRVMLDFFGSGGGSGCNGLIANSNDEPVIDIPMMDKTMPHSTPFALTVFASDVNGDALTYAFDQDDPAVAPAPPVNTATDGPAFRSLRPTLSNTRYFPNFDDVINNIDPTWEELSTVARNYEFLATVRDNNSAGGCIVQDTVNLVVDGTAGPFLVNVPNGGQVYSGNQFAAISWDVAGTDNGSTVNCQKVNIYCYTDLPNKTRFLIAENVDNDGAHNVLMPNVQSANCRIMVAAADNYFYDISDANFTINLNADLCADAINISCGDIKYGNTTAATDAAEASPCSGPPGGGGIGFDFGVWYTFSGTGASVTISTDNPGTDYDTELQVWSGSCGALTCVGGDDDGGNGLTSSITFNTVIGTTYYVYVDGHLSNRGNYGLSLDCAAPTNNLQANAIEITCDDISITGQTLSADTTGQPSNCITSISAPGVWYSIDGIGADITLDLCGSPYDSKINVYRDDAGSLTCIIGEDDDFANCGPGNDPSVTFTSDVGKTYYVYVQGFNGSTGSFTLNISCECSGLVINTDDSGYGSLRDNVACAMPGDTILFDASIDGSPIELLTVISLNKELYVLGNGPDETIIDGSLDSAARLFSIPSSGGQGVTISGMTIQHGGGLTSNNFGGAIIANGKAKFENCVFHDNLARAGGAVYSALDTADFVNCIFYDNEANTQGGAINTISGVLNVTNCLFYDNDGGAFGGAIYIFGGTSSRLHVQNTTIVNNEASLGGGISFGTTPTQVELANAIVYGNMASTGPDIRQADGATITTNQRNIIGDLTSSGLTSAYFVGDPMFTDPLNDDYSLTACSPGVNAGFNYPGLPATDLDGNNRIEAWAVDLGSYEYDGVPCSVGQCSDPIPLICDSLYSGTTSQGGNFLDGYSCTSDYEDGPDIVHEITVATPGDITVTLTDLSTLDLDVFLLNACDPDSCLAWDYTNFIANVAAGTYLIVVDGYDESYGDYELLVNCPVGGPCTEDTVMVNVPESPMGLYHAIIELQSDATITTTGVEYKAGTSILLNENFEVELGNEFDASIEPCVPSALNGENNDRSIRKDNTDERINQERTREASQSRIRK